MLLNLYFALYQFFFNLCAICTCALPILFFYLRNLRLCFYDFIFCLRSGRVRNLTAELFASAAYKEHTVLSLHQKPRVSIDRDF